MENTTFCSIMYNIKIITNAKNDSELANILNINKGNFSKYKKNGTIPYKNIVEFAIKNNTDLNKIFCINTTSYDDLNHLFNKLSDKEKEMYIAEIKARILRKELQ